MNDGIGEHPHVWSAFTMPGTVLNLPEYLKQLKNLQFREVTAFPKVTQPRRGLVGLQS